MVKAPLVKVPLVEAPLVKAPLVKEPLVKVTSHYLDCCLYFHPSVMHSLLQPANTRSILNLWPLFGVQIHTGQLELLVH